MCSKSKYFWKIVLAEFRGRELLSRKLKNFISVRIELAGGLDHLCLKEYPWIPVSLTVTIFDRLEKPVFQVAIFHFAACAKCRERCRLAFEGLDNVYLEVLRQILRQNYSEAE